MNAFFFTRLSYHVDEPVEDVRDRIQGMTSGKWYRLSKNISGRRKTDGSYLLTNKWNLMYTNWIESGGAYLNLKIHKVNNKTEIHATIRPNSLFVLFFYLIIILFFFEIFGVTLVYGPKIYILVFLVLFDSLLFLLIKLMTSSLLKKFEKIMHI